MIPQAAKNRNQLPVLYIYLFIFKTPFNLQMPSLVPRTSAYLLQLIQFVSNRLVVRLQLIKPLLQLLLLLQHRQSIFSRLDLFMGRFTELSAEAVHLGSEPLRPGLCHQHRVGTFLLLHRHLGVPVERDRALANGISVEHTTDTADRHRLCLNRMVSTQKALISPLRYAPQKRPAERTLLSFSRSFLSLSVKLTENLSWDHRLEKATNKRHSNVCIHSGKCSFTHCLSGTTTTRFRLHFDFKYQGAFRWFDSGLVLMLQCHLEALRWHYKCSSGTRLLCLDVPQKNKTEDCIHCICIFCDCVNYLKRSISIKHEYGNYYSKWWWIT